MKGKLTEPYPGYAECCRRWAKVRAAIPNDLWSKSYAELAAKDKPSQVLTKVDHLPLVREAWREADASAAIGGGAGAYRTLSRRLDAIRAFAA